MTKMQEKHERQYGMCQDVATRDAANFLQTQSSNAQRCSRTSAVRMLIFAVVAVCLQPISGSCTRCVPSRRGSGTGNLAEMRLDPSSIPAQLCSHVSPSPPSSSSGSPLCSSLDVSKGRPNGASALAYAIKAAQKARRRDLHATRSSVGLRRTTSYRAGLSCAEEVGGSVESKLDLQSPQPRRREDWEYRARGDPSSKVFTRLQTGLYPDLKLS